MLLACDAFQLHRNNLDGVSELFKALQKIMFEGGKRQKKGKRR
jgi:hypothetical protein